MQTIKYRKIIELSQPLDEKITSWPDDKTPEKPFVKKILSRYKENGFYYNLISFPEHTATHIDAPVHLCEGKYSIDQIPVENFIMNACVIDTKTKVKKDPDYQLLIDDILFWEKINGKIKSNSFIIMRTDWSEYWHKPAQYLNIDNSGIMHFPGFSPDSVEFLVRERAICGIGVETLSIDPGYSRDFLVHKILFENNKFAIENLTNIKFLPLKNFKIIALPLKIVEGSGSPVTVIGLI